MQRSLFEHIETTVPSSPPPRVRQATGDTTQRDVLETQYASRFREMLHYRQLVTYVPNKNTPVYNWFRYKEGFSRELVFNFLGEFDVSPPEIVFDPFTGSGTTLLACAEKGIPSLGLEILPVAGFVAQVKLERDYDFPVLRKTIDHLEQVPIGEPTLSMPEVRIIPLAYTEETVRDLLFFKEQILAQPDQKIRQFLLVGLLSILENVSFTAKDGQFLRLKKDKPIPEVREILLRQLRQMYTDVREAKIGRTLLDYSPTRSWATARILTGDARRMPLGDGCVHHVITSPPYLNRYDYSRTYSLELCLHFVESFEDLRAIRHSLLRSHIESKPAPTDDVHHPALDEILDHIHAKEKLNNPKIPVMIKGYFEDMNDVVKELHRVMHPGGKVALVVANARFEGEHIPVDLILSELAESVGFRPISIWITRYKGNSSQQMGKYGRSPVRESIVLWER